MEAVAEQEVPLIAEHGETQTAVERALGHGALAGARRFPVREWRCAGLRLR